MNKEVSVAVVGATGAVGEAMLSILAEREFPVKEVYALASSRSVGTRVPFKDDELVVQNLAEFDFARAQFALFSAGTTVSAEYAPKAAQQGCIVIDNSSYFRYQDEIPLVVPEVNANALSRYTNRFIVANPNCSTIQMVVALKPIYDCAGIDRINVCTYQAVSGAGSKAIEELAGQTAALLNGKEPVAGVHAKQIAFNAVPHIDVFQDNGYTKEEMKIIWETQKILEDDTVRINPTAVRVPVFYGHSEAIHIETRSNISANEARELLRHAPGVVVVDECAPGGYPTAATEAAHNDHVYVGRIRDDLSHDKGLDLWVVSDNVRKGAALNSVQIAESLLKEHL